MSQSVFLAVDTSHNKAQLLLFTETEVLFEKSWEKSKSHSEVITVAFEELIRQADLEISDLKKIFCVAGPGSFTGLRVGINFSKTLAYSINCPMGVINTLDLLALNAATEDKTVMATVDAQKNSVFYSLYHPSDQGLKKIESNQICDVRKLQEIVTGEVALCGRGIQKYLDFVDKEFQSNLIRHERFLNCELKNLLIPNQLIALNQSVNWQEVQPLYIKASAPEEKLNPTST